MLFTNRYIKMCKEAKEIQKDWKPKVGDYCVCSRRMIGILTSDKKQKVTYPDGNTGYAYVGVRLKDGALWSSRKPIWLPTQEQLQEMVTTNSASSHKDCELIEDFHLWFCEFFKRLYSRPAVDDWIMNQFWLVYIMYKNYNKVWHYHKEKWVKRKE